MTKHFDDQNFEQEVIVASGSKPVLVDFFAEWCGPCKLMAPIIDELAKSMGDKADVGKLNTENAMDTAQKFGIMSIPTILIFRNGQVVEQLIGVQPLESLQALLQKHQ